MFVLPTIHFLLLRRRFTLSLTLHFWSWRWNSAWFPLYWIIGFRLIFLFAISNVFKFTSFLKSCWEKSKHFWKQCWIWKNTC